MFRLPKLKRRRDSEDLTAVLKPRMIGSTDFTFALRCFVDSYFVCYVLVIHRGWVPLYDVLAVMASSLLHVPFFASASSRSSSIFLEPVSVPFVCA
jgi:hypothetical protein